ncbi:KR domain-containing protein [Mycobacterium riyadhense]|uniref:KR domain-containing protein n=1 Tax=Mycobacterium riyadhense TaxID=486698 RepID=UPI00195941A2
MLHAKADPAWHLHQLTSDHDLAAFVMFSSATATLGNPAKPTTPPPTPSSTLAHHHPPPPAWPGATGKPPPA